MTTVSEDARFLTLGPELAARIQARDFILLSYMALAGTLLSASLTKGDQNELALAIPYIAFATALITTHHDLIINIIGDFMRELSKNSPGLRWHHDPVFLARGKSYRTIRHLGAGFFMVFTVASSLFVNHEHILRGNSKTFLPCAIWWGGLLSGIAVLGVMIFTWGIRNDKPFAKRILKIADPE